MAHFIFFGLCHVIMVEKNTITVLNLVYIVLVALTFASFYVGETGIKSLVISMGVFAVAIFKATMISEYFMQLRLVSGFWRLPVIIWLAILSIVIFLAFSL